MLVAPPVTAAVPWESAVQGEVLRSGEAGFAGCMLWWTLFFCKLLHRCGVVGVVDPLN